MTDALDTIAPRLDRSPRKRTYKKASIRHKESGGDKSCILRNISETGALLEFDEAKGLPMFFTVQVELDAFEVPAQWVRREGQRVGVKFTGDTKDLKPSRTQILKSPDDPTLRRSAVEDEFRKQLYELRKQQTLGSAEASSSSTGFAKKPSRGFGKRGTN